MTWLSAYAILSVVFGVTGLLLASGLRPVYQTFRAFPRSLVATLLFWGTSLVWFILRITQLSEADLSGFSRELLVGGFSVAGLLAFFSLRDLLAVRGLAALLLLSAHELLKAGFMQQPHNLVLSTIAYVFVVFGIWWGFAPFVFRNWFFWILEKPVRAKVTGACITACGMLCLATFFYIR